MRATRTEKICTTNPTPGNSDKQYNRSPAPDLFATEKPKYLEGNLKLDTTPGGHLLYKQPPCIALGYNKGEMLVLLNSFKSNRDRRPRLIEVMRHYVYIHFEPIIPQAVKVMNDHWKVPIRTLQSFFIIPGSFESILRRYGILKPTEESRDQKHRDSYDSRTANIRS